MILDPTVQQIVEWMNGPVADAIRELGHEPRPVSDLLPGHRGCSDSCPIANTLMWMVPGVSHAEVGISVILYLGSEPVRRVSFCNYKVPPAVGAFIVAFDRSPYSDPPAGRFEEYDVTFTG